MLNRTVLVGRICKEIDLRYSPSGVAIANFTLAVERNFKTDGQKETDFIPCVAFKQTAEYAANYIAKGKLASVDGRLQVRTYDGNDGQKRYVTEVICDNVHGLSPRDSSEQQNSNNATGSTPTSSFGREVQLDDDIPF